MKRYFKLSFAIALVFAMLLSLCACGTPAPAVSAAPDEAVSPAAQGDGRIHVSTVDELLAAIAPDAAIYLENGTYDLTTASDYGKTDSKYYSWSQVYEGYELVIKGVSGLSLTAGLDESKAPVTSIVTVPRMANVLRFENCEDISMFGVVVGHTEEPGVCSGGVISMTNVDDAVFEYCELFGCGTIGLDLAGCEDVTLKNSVIRHCTVGAVSVSRSRAVAVKLCEIYDCGDFRLFSFDASADCAVLNCTIYNNSAMVFAESTTSKNINLLGCTVKDNTLSDYMFSTGQQGEPIIVAGCEFVQNTMPAWFGNEAGSAVGTDGTKLSEAELETMVCEYIEWVLPTEENDKVSGASGQVTVSTVDELLAAIAPNTTIYLEPGTYDLTTASDYGVFGSRYYIWNDIFDGAELVISGVNGLAILGSDTAEVTICTQPRYANVLSFTDCNDLYLGKFTAGHTEARGECSGGVVRLDECKNAVIQDCSLFGCGIIGVDAFDCDELSVFDTEIYDCSLGAVQLMDCEEAKLTNCNIHDMPDGTYTYNLNGDSTATIDGKAVKASGEQAYQDA